MAHGRERPLGASAQREELNLRASQEKKAAPDGVSSLGAEVHQGSQAGRAALAVGNEGHGKKTQHPLPKTTPFCSAYKGSKFVPIPVFVIRCSPGSQST